MPDYTITPEGAAYGIPEERRRAIVAFNEIMEEATRQRRVAFVDIFDVSGGVRDDPSLVAADGLHASGAQYRLWVDEIAPVVEALLGE